MKRLSVVVAAAMLAAATASAHAEISDPVQVDSGKISGIPANPDGIRVFKGIPFGAPPVGDLRWKEPQPVAKWGGVYKADHFRDVCIQPPGQGRQNIAVDVPGSPKMSEDCLYLNVWTGAAKASEKRPVMVWIYGGAFTEGAGSIGLYDGDVLAKKGAVVVTLNYRLGPFGFFAHPALAAESPHHTSGNYGITDMLAALHWVQKNIAAFGGDPDNVTVFGQSAGAMAISALVGSPRSKGLFHRAISESGNWMGLRMGAMAPYAPAEAAGLKKAEAAGAKSLADLRAMSAEEVTAKLGGRGLGGGMVADGYIFPKDLNKVFSTGQQNAVDVLVGSNAHESFFPGGPKAEQFKAQLKPRWGDLTPAVLKVYPAGTDAEAAASSAAMFSDEVTWLMRLYASDQLKLGKKAYVFSFAYNPPSPPGKQAFPTHAAEIPYVFDNLGQPHLFPDMSSPELAAKSAEARKLADTMSSYWVNFAKTGNPNGDGLPNWPAYTGIDTGKAMILDAKTMAEKKPDTAMLDLYTKLYNRETAGNASGK